jgi:hypothetical protein
MWLIIEACHGAVVVSESFGYQECATYGFQALQPRVGWLWIRLLLGVGKTLSVRRCMDFGRHGETVQEPSFSPDMATISMPNEAFLSLYIQRSDSIEVFVKTE